MRSDSTTSSLCSTSSSVSVGILFSCPTKYLRRAGGFGRHRGDCGAAWIGGRGVSTRAAGEGGTDWSISSEYFSLGRSPPLTMLFSDLNIPLRCPRPRRGAAQCPGMGERGGATTLMNLAPPHLFALVPLHASAPPLFHRPTASHRPKLRGLLCFRSLYPRGLRSTGGKQQRQSMSLAYEYQTGFLENHLCGAKELFASPRKFSEFHPPSI